MMNVSCQQSFVAFSLHSCSHKDFLMLLDNNGNLSSFFKQSIFLNSFQRSGEKDKLCTAYVCYVCYIHLKAYCSVTGTSFTLLQMYDST